MDYSVIPRIFSTLGFGFIKSHTEYFLSMQTKYDVLSHQSLRSRRMISIITLHA
jgi:hypothetical protein